MNWHSLFFSNWTKPCRLFLPQWVGGDEPGTRRSCSLFGFQDLGCTICATGRSQGAQQQGRVLECGLETFSTRESRWFESGIDFFSFWSVVFPPCVKSQAKSAATILFVENKFHTKRSHNVQTAVDRLTCWPFDWLHSEFHTLMLMY